MKPLSSTPMFQIAQKTSDFDNSIARMMNEDRGRIDIDNLSDVVMEIKRYKYPLRDLVLNALRNDSIRLHHSEDPTKLIADTKFPFTLHQFKSDGRIRAIVNLTPYNKRLDRISTATIYALVESALIAMTLAKTPRWSEFTRIERTVLSGAGVFVDLLQSVLDRLVMAAFDEVVTDQMRYIIAQYYLRYRLDIQNESTVFDMARRLRRYNTPAEEFDAVDSYVTTGRLNTGFVDMIGQLKIGIPSLSKISPQVVVSEWAKRYGEATLLSLEYAPYWVYMVNSAQRVNHAIKVVPVGKSTNPDLIKRFINQIESLVQE